MNAQVQMDGARLSWASGALIGGLLVLLATCFSAYRLADQVGSTSPLTFVAIAGALLVATWLVTWLMAIWLGVWGSGLIACGSIGGQVVSQLGMRLGWGVALIAGEAICAMAILAAINHKARSNVESCQSGGQTSASCSTSSAREEAENARVRQ